MGNERTGGWAWCRAGRAFEARARRGQAGCITHVHLLERVRRVKVNDRGPTGGNVGRQERGDLALELGAVVVHDHVVGTKQQVPRHPVLEQPALVTHDNGDYQPPLPLRRHGASRQVRRVRRVRPPLASCTVRRHGCWRQRLCRPRGQALCQHLLPKHAEWQPPCRCLGSHRACDAPGGVVPHTDHHPVIDAA